MKSLSRFVDSLTRVGLDSASTGSRASSTRCSFFSRVSRFRAYVYSFFRSFFTSYEAKCSFFLRYLGIPVCKESLATFTTAKTIVATTCLSYFILDFFLKSFCFLLIRYD